MRLAVLAPLACAALLAGCGPSEESEGPGGISVGEARALNEAAQALDLNIVTETVPANASADPR